MQLSIIIVSYNVQNYLQLCLDSVCAAIQTMEAQVIVVDNASQDESVAMVKNKFPEVACIVNTYNIGFSKANNLGVEQATGEYVCILNPDTVVAEDTFEKVYAFAKAQQNLGAIGVRLIDGSGHFLPESKRNLPTPKVSFHKMMGNGSSYYASDVQATQNGKVSVLVGAFMVLKKSIYQEVGGFDERYFMYGEDIDLSYTITQAGYDNYYFGECPIIHFKGESTVKDKKYRQRFYGAMSLFYDKHLSTNFIKSAVVKLGLKVVQMASRLSQQSAMVTSTPTAATHYYLITDVPRVVDNLRQSVATQVEVAQQISDVKAGSEIVFDTTYVSYKDCIAMMLRFEDAGTTFKFIPKNSTFAIGSNSSEGRGDILILSQ